MKPLIQCKTTILPLFIAGVLGCFEFLPKALAVVPAPDGGYPGGNTAEGQNALFSLTTGVHNTAVGFVSLRSDTAGSYNTAVGAGTLLANTGDENTATGFGALLSNSTGGGNTANGSLALFYNTTGTQNVAVGWHALESNVIGNYNTAIGFRSLTLNTADNNTATGINTLIFNTLGTRNTADGGNALQSNTLGVNNTADGFNALFNNTTGNGNTANGANALFNNTTGGDNTANGAYALHSNTTGNNNVALGFSAGYSLTTGDGNVCIGQDVVGVAGESNTTRISNIYSSVANGRQVYVNSDNKIGTLSSSRRYKEQIKPMDKASEAIFWLKPVTFRYKKEVDPTHCLGSGLIAEEVAEVNPDLVTCDAEGKPETVRYEAVNAMLLNEFLKEHRKNEEQQATIATLKSTGAKQEATIARQQKQIEALTTGLQKLSAQLELSKPAPQTALNNE